MFSGGVLSSNLTRSFGKLRDKHQANKKNSNKRRRARKVTRNDTLKSENYLNWDEHDVKKKNNPNTNPTYALEVKGKIRFRSFATCVFVLGVAILLGGSLLTMCDKNLIGPVNIGIGIYTMVMGFCWLMDNRNHDKKFCHLQDLYVGFAAKKHKKIADKAVQVGRTTKDTKQDIPMIVLSSETQNIVNFPKKDNEKIISTPFQLNQQDIQVLQEKSEKAAEPQGTTEEQADKKIHPKLVKRFSMKELSYDISFDPPCLKVTNC